MATLHPLPPRRPRKRATTSKQSTLRRLSRQPLLVLVLIFAAVATDRFYTSTDSDAAAGTNGALSGHVERVIDGDTFVLADGRRIRLWGLDAPERDTAEGPAATAALEVIVGRSFVTCDDMGESYNRTVGRCYLADGRDVSRAMIETGTADQYCRFSKGYYNGAGGRTC
ncbi:thermonuclease family protein [Gimibacter soli]|uniref:thermonuclease family protein n=1 Tax=Gimibacter soli TaxID=3024400 RepID=UPI003365910E